MHSTKLQRLSLIVVVALLLSGILACDFGGGAGTATPLVTLESPGAAKPRVIVTSPVSGIELEVGQQVEIVCIAEDPKGIISVELAVDGVLYATETSPNAAGEPQWKFVETWAAKVDPGIHTLTITAYNVDKVASDPMAIAVTVVEASAPQATGAVTLATSTPAAPGTTATVPPPGPTETAAAPAPTWTTAAPMPTNTPVPPPTSTPAPGLPDLIISELYVTPANPAYGASGQATFTIRNAGSAPAGDCHVMYIWAESGTPRGCDRYTGPLSAGAEITLECTAGPFYTSYETHVLVDTGGVVAESNENNNWGGFMVNVAAGALPDLTIEELSLNPWPYWGNESDATITVANQGSGDAGSFQLRYYWAESGACWWPMDPLPAGAEVTVSCHVGPFSGPFNTYAMADVISEVAESNEDNNRRDLYVEAG